MPHSTRLCLRASASRPDFLSFKPRQKFVSLPIASFANPVAHTEPLSDTSECRQLHHCRMRLLEFPLQMTILPHVSDDSRAKIREMSLSFSMKTSRLPCDVPSGRVVHPASVYVTRRIMSVDFEWRFGPYSRFPSQLAHHKSCPNEACGVSHPSTATEAPTTVADVACPRQLATQGSKLRQLKWRDLGLSVSSSM